MTFKHFFPIVLLMLSFGLANTAVFANGPHSGMEVFSCNIPAPANFMSREIGSTWVNLVWDTEPQAVGGYRIRTYRASDNALISTIFRAQDQTKATITGLTPGVGYNFVINSIGEGNCNSSNVAIDGPVYTLIGEIIVSGFTNGGDYNAPPICPITTSSPNPSQALTPGSFCTFMATENNVPFRAYAEGQFLNFEVSMPTMNFSTVLPYCNFSGLHIEKSGGGNIHCTASGLGSAAVMMGTTPVAEYSWIKSGNVVIVVCTSLSPGWQIARYPFRNALTDEGGTKTGYAAAERGVEGAGAITSVQPNPFSDYLEVQLDAAPAAPAQLQLFNLGGQVVLSQQLEAGSTQNISLPTATLAPGFYWLRYTSGGVSSAWKVLKTQ